MPTVFLKDFPQISDYELFIFLQASVLEVPKYFSSTYNPNPKHKDRIYFDTLRKLALVFI